jgi:hypothetical protein
MKPVKTAINSLPILICSRIRKYFKTQGSSEVIESKHSKPALAIKTLNIYSQANSIKLCPIGELQATYTGEPSE